MATAPIRLAVGDDRPFVRQLLRLALASRAISVVAEAGSCRDLELLCKADRPDVALSAETLGGTDLIATIAVLSALGIDVLVLAAEPSAESAAECLLAGAAGYVSSDLAVDGLAEAIRAVHAGASPVDPWCAAPIVRQWRDLRSADGEQPATTPLLSGRELEILGLLASGKATKAIAAALALSTKTVDNHKTRIFDKLGVHSQTEAVSVGIAHGLVGNGGDRAAGRR